VILWRRLKQVCWYTYPEITYVALMAVAFVLVYFLHVKRPDIVRRLVESVLGNTTSGR
jgi:hypothetical protein